MTTNTQLYSIAAKYLNYGGTIFQKYCGLGSGQPWCNAYVCYVFNAGGLKNIYYGGKKVVSCPTSINWCKTHYPMVPLYLAMPMDVIYFDWNKNNVPDHIGFVKERESTSVIKTIEGNTSGGKVDTKRREGKYVLGVFRPPYKPASLPKTYELSSNDTFGYPEIYAIQHLLKLPENGILDIKTVKEIQKIFGTTADGAWGTATSKKIQKVIGVTADGEFGPKSVKAFKNWINSQNGYKTKPVEKKAYSGKFPSLIPATARYAVEFAYPLNSSSTNYNYIGGKPKTAYKKALEKAYPDKSKWGKRTSAGASCDVFAGTVMRASGTDPNFPRGLDGQVPHLKKNYVKISKPGNGDILLKNSSHIGIAVSIKGTLYNADAHYGVDGVQYSKYPRIHAMHSYTAYYDPKAKLTDLMFGDKFTDVIYLQKFLNWYGNYGLKEDYIFGTATENAVKDFQKANRLTVDGKFGAKSLAMAKTIKK